MSDDVVSIRNAITRRSSPNEHHRYSITNGKPIRAPDAPSVTITVDDGCGAVVTTTTMLGNRRNMQTKNAMRYL